MTTTAVTLKKVPEKLHRDIKRLQLDYEDNKINMTIEEIYLDLINRGLKEVKANFPKPN